MEWGPDFVVIASPSNLHAEQALQAATGDCHLFIEKPLSYSLDRLGELLAEVNNRRLISFVGCNMRFHPGPAAIKELLHREAVGAVISARLQTGSYLPRWRPWQDYRQSYSASVEWGGAILDCIHEIDLALWYFGPGSVLAAAHLPAQNLGLQTDGLAEIILRHESSILSSIHLNFLQRDYRRTCQIIGEEGTIYWDFADHQVRVHGENGDIKEMFPKPEGWQVNQMYLDELEYFLWAVRSGSQTVNPISSGVAALEVALAARRMGTETPA
jgi:predicted dehydrogenase